MNNINRFRVVSVSVLLLVIGASGLPALGHVSSPPPPPAPNANLEAQIADLKAKTAALIAASRSQPKYADLLGRSRALSGEQAIATFKAAFDLWKSGDLSQTQFADRYGFSVETIRNYEQGHRAPAGPARALLRVIAHEPDAVTRALAKGR